MEHGHVQEHYHKVGKHMNLDGFVIVYRLQNDYTRWIHVLPEKKKTSSGISWNMLIKCHLNITHVQQNMFLCDYF